MQPASLLNWSFLLLKKKNLGIYYQYGANFALVMKLHRSKMVIVHKLILLP